MSSTKDVTCRSDPAHLWPGMSPVTSLPPPPIRTTTWARSAPPPREGAGRRGPLMLPSPPSRSRPDSGTDYHPARLPFVAHTKLLPAPKTSSSVCRRKNPFAKMSPNIST